MKINFKLLFTAAVILFLTACAASSVVLREGAWIKKPNEKILQISMVWVSGVNDDWTIKTRSANPYAPTSLGGGGLPPLALKLGYIQIDQYFKNEGDPLLKQFNLTGATYAVDSQKDIASAVRGSTGLPYVLIFNADQFQQFSQSGQNVLNIFVNANLVDIRSGAVLWTGKYNLHGTTFGRLITTSQVKAVQTAALRSITQ